MAPQPFDKNRDGLVMGEGAADPDPRDANLMPGSGAPISWPSWPAMAQPQMPSMSLLRMRTGQVALRPCAWLWIRPARMWMILVTSMRMERAHLERSVGDACHQSCLRRKGLSDSCLVHQVHDRSHDGRNRRGGSYFLRAGRYERGFCRPPSIMRPLTLNVTWITSPIQAREKKVDLAISNAFGFGGHNAVLAIRKYN